ncbi:uncharacterized protein BXZ73DRAFT_100765 [Epithele typhae]|uniref:uncharacterized protein n=1 Tax=Epithele typhae TaxID=378194 RepID=UPI002008C6B9|nr:uncharacterized protein BXZ73DRAFT_100765 [Epithele typhae]KAH9934574.1 hypothetical protein BXZ73DRAFT_100765 [Epithele typhae]
MTSSSAHTTSSSSSTAIVLSVTVRGSVTVTLTSSANATADASVSTASHSSGVSTAVLVGSILGAVLFCALLAVLGICLYRRRRQNMRKSVRLSRFEPGSLVNPPTLDLKAKRDGKTEDEKKWDYRMSYASAATLPPYHSYEPAPTATPATATAPAFDHARGGIARSPTPSDVGDGEAPYGSAHDGDGIRNAASTECLVDRSGLAEGGGSGGRARARSAYLTALPPLTGRVPSTNGRERSAAPIGFWTSLGVRACREADGYKEAEGGRMVPVVCARPLRLAAMSGSSCMPGGGVVPASDPAILFDGSWQRTSSFNGTTSAATNTSGATASYGFNGTHLQVFGTLHENNMSCDSSISFRIDQNSLVTFSKLNESNFEAKQDDMAKYHTKKKEGKDKRDGPPEPPCSSFLLFDSGTLSDPHNHTLQITDNCGRVVLNHLLLTPVVPNDAGGHNGYNGEAPGYHGGLTAGEIAGITIGICIAFALAAAAIFGLVYRRRRKLRKGNLTQFNPRSLVTPWPFIARRWRGEMQSPPSIAPTLPPYQSYAPAPDEGSVLNETMRRYFESTPPQYLEHTGTSGHRPRLPPLAPGTHMEKERQSCVLDIGEKHSDRYGVAAA